MSDLLEKLSSYNLFNYLLPGVIFSFVADKIGQFGLMTDNLVVGFFLYYFIGLIISRFGSLIVEPLLKRISFLKFATYKAFVEASKIDKKIEIFSEANNMYRTFCSMFLLLILSKLYSLFEAIIPQLQGWSVEILVVVLLLLFLFSYKKQTDYIRKRIESINN